MRQRINKEFVLIIICVTAFYLCLSNLTTKWIINERRTDFVYFVLNAAFCPRQENVSPLNGTHATLMQCLCLRAINYFSRAKTSCTDCSTHQHQIPVKPLSSVTRCFTLFYLPIFLCLLKYAKSSSHMNNLGILGRVPATNKLACPLDAWTRASLSK